MLVKRLILSDLLIYADRFGPFPDGKRLGRATPGCASLRLFAAQKSQALRIPKAGAELKQNK
jgi:hypothetical protein